MIGRLVNAPPLRRLTVRLLPALLLLAISTLSACKKKEKPFPPAPQLVSTATTAGAALATADAGLVAIPASALADTMAPADRAALQQVKDSVNELDSMVKRNAFTNPDKPGEGDANAQCAAVETPRARLEALDDPEAKRLVTESKRLCALEVPLLSADRTLKQVSISPSQASRQLMCKYASKDLDKARAAKASDRRLRDLDGRFARACR